MSWITIVAAIIQIFGPYLSDLFKKLMDKWFNKAQTNLAGIDPSTLPPEEAVGKLFDEVENNLPRVAVARRLMLKIMKRISLKHAAKITTGEVVALDAQDMDELNLLNKMI